MDSLLIDGAGPAAADPLADTEPGGCMRPPGPGAAPAEAAGEGNCIRVEGWAVAWAWIRRPFPSSLLNHCPVSSWMQAKCVWTVKAGSVSFSPVKSREC